MRRVSWIVMILLAGCVVSSQHYREADEAVDWDEVELEVTITCSKHGIPCDIWDTLTLPQMCAYLHPSDPDRVWDDERELYLPINVRWEDCIGVGRK